MARIVARVICYVLLVASGCAINPVTNTPIIALESVEKERRSGEEMAKIVAEQLGFAGNAELRRYVERIGARLAARSPRTNVTYQFAVVDMQEPNAFALPGGYVYVSRGLLALVNSEDELAGVLGHEIGHVAALHHTQQQARSVLTTPFTMVTGLAGAVTGIVAPPLGSAIAGAGELASGAYLAHYSREQEREADQIGMRLAAECGWSPAGMTEVLTTLSREEKFVQGSQRKATFLDSHPTSLERAAATAEAMKQLVPAEPDPIAPDRRAFLDKLAGLLVGEDPGDGIFEGSRFVHPKLGFSIEFGADWQTQDARSFVIAAAPDGKALSVLEAIGKSDDPLAGAAAVRRKMGFELADVERIEIGDLPAAHYVGRGMTRQGPVVVDLTWIAHAGTVFQITGAMAEAAYASDGAILTAIASSFRPVTQAEVARITESRLRIVTVRGTETIERLLDRVGGAWGPAMAAIANGIEVGAPLMAGRLVKVPMVEAYSGSGP